MSDQEATRFDQIAARADGRDGPWPNEAAIRLDVEWLLDRVRGLVAEVLALEAELRSHHQPIEAQTNQRS